MLLFANNMADSPRRNRISLSTSLSRLSIPLSRLSIPSSRLSIPFSRLSIPLNRLSRYAYSPCTQAGAAWGHLGRYSGERKASLVGNSFSSVARSLIGLSDMEVLKQGSALTFSSNLGNQCYLLPRGCRDQNAGPDPGWLVAAWGSKKIIRHCQKNCPLRPI